jgi:hypothetical protein
VREHDATMVRTQTTRPRIGGYCYAATVLEWMALAAVAVATLAVVVAAIVWLVGFLGNTRPPIAESDVDHVRSGTSPRPPGVGK